MTAIRGTLAKSILSGLGCVQKFAAVVSRTLAGCPNCHYRPAWTWWDDTVWDVSGQVEYVCALIGSCVQHCVIIPQFFPKSKVSYVSVQICMAGSGIALFSDFLGDTRFGFCYGIFLADRNRCCGGSENVDFLLERNLGSESTQGRQVEVVRQCQAHGVLETVESFNRVRTCFFWFAIDTRTIAYVYCIYNYIFIHMHWCLMILEHWCTMFWPWHLNDTRWKLE